MPRCLLIAVSAIARYILRCTLSFYYQAALRHLAPQGPGRTKHYSLVVSGRIRDAQLLCKAGLEKANTGVLRKGFAPAGLEALGKAVRNFGEDRGSM